MDLQDLNGELKVLEEWQGLELGALKSTSFQNSGSSREVMRTGSSIPELSKLMKRSALARQSSETRSACLEALDTIREDDLEALAHEVCPTSTPVRSDTMGLAGVAMQVLVVGGLHASKVRALKLCLQASAESQLSSRQMVGEETPAAYVHPAQEATAIAQADGTVLGQLESQGQGSSSEALPMRDEEVSPHCHLQQCIRADHFIGLRTAGLSASTSCLSSSCSGVLGSAGA